jgi:hypothetical protein
MTTLKITLESVEPRTTFCRGGIHSQEMIKVKFLRSRNPGFLIGFFPYLFNFAFKNLKMALQRGDSFFFR